MSIGKHLVSEGVLVTKRFLFFVFLVPLDQQGRGLICSLLDIFVRVGLLVPGHLIRYESNAKWQEHSVPVIVR